MLDIKKLSTVIIESIKTINKYNSYLGQVEYLIKEQIKDFNFDEFISVKNHLKNEDDTFHIHWNFAYVNYSLLVFSKDFITEDSPIYKIRRADSHLWVSLKSLDLAIEKIKSTGFVVFDEQKLRESSIAHLMINFLKNIDVFQNTFDTATANLKKGSKRIASLRTGVPLTNDIRFIEMFNESLMEFFSDYAFNTSIQPLDTSSILRKIMFPYKEKFVLPQFQDFIENISGENLLGLISLTDNAIKQTAYLSAIDLINILKPSHIMDIQVWIDKSKSKHSTPNYYFKVYAKKRILNMGIFK
jgi:hypothetical protein